MINYILLSSLFSISGGIIYLIFKNQLSLKIAKWMIYSIILCSLLFPVFKSQLIHKFITPNQLVMDVIDKQSGAVVKSHYFPSNKNYKYCYKEENKKCASEESFLQADFSSKQESSLFLLSVLSLIFFSFLSFIYQVYKVYRLYQNSEKEVCSIGNIKYTKLVKSDSEGVGAFSFFNNFIIWPDYLNNLDKEEQEAILNHEISHIKQKNTIEKIALTLLRLIWILNPVLYLFYKELDRISEYVADDYAIAKGICKKKYATLLLKLKEFQNCNYALVQYFGEKSLLKARIMRIMQAEKKVFKNQLSFKGFALLCLTFVGYIYFFFSINLNEATANTKQKLWKACSEVQASKVNTCNISWR